MDADSSVLIFSEGNVADAHLDLSDLDVSIKTNNKLSNKLKHGRAYTSII